MIIECESEEDLQMLATVDMFRTENQKLAAVCMHTNIASGGMQ